MHSIAEYQSLREKAVAVSLTEIPEVRPYARRHVEQLSNQGHAGAIIKQLCREAQSSRRTTDDSGLSNREALYAGLAVFRAALETAKQTKRKVSKIEHKGGKYNPINAVDVAAQAGATWDAICGMLGRMADLDRPLSVQTLAGALAGRLRNLTGGAPEYGGLGYERAALLLLDHFCAATGWLEERTGETKMMSKVRKPNTYHLTGKFLDEVAVGGLVADFAERRPMLVPPVPWTTFSTHGGYLHDQIPAVRGTRRPIESEVIVSALNALQATRFRVNRRVLEVAQTFRTNAEDMGGAVINGRYIETRHDKPESMRRAKTIRSALTLSAFVELVDEDAFYFPWNLDWRGRMYPATSLISPQGADLCKGCLEFADGTPLGRDGGKWLAIHLCNLAGEDKVTVGGKKVHRTPDEREAWTLSQESTILRVAADPRNNMEWMKADKPWQFLAACFEWVGYREEGDAFRSRLAGALDGSCSGVQMLAGMTRDASAGAMVNLVPSERGDDYYGRMAEALSKRLCGLVDHADTATMARLQFWAEKSIDRDLLKAPSMTKVYSAGTYTFGEQVQNKTGAPEAESMWLAAQINACFSDVAPGMLRAMSYLQAVSDVMTAAGLPLVWRTPAGLRVEQARTCTRSVPLETQIGGPESRKQRRFTVDTGDLSKNDQRAGVAPNFVHGVDASHMAYVVNDLYARGVRNFWMIHDSFGAPFAQCGEVFRSTREQFIALMSPDLLRRWADDVTAALTDAQRAGLPEFPSYGSLDIGVVRESVYAWF
ncbi:DNA-directed RNA polymerase [Burkholderia pseudomallei]|uniref:DNA-directed RNA polymerase n=1 Tax=Burkholderia pseudomallei TaxID=28450 RepID=UPI000F057724|nr:DNA-directed RNA polymerase [Burkholderia pseudomallei]CAJ3296826.1 DNA-dependent RNA polymerase [Burkholderia pseudomallei]CAJ5881709.1 DNA-dependent RNA polymerase [Burkholderia pseudomallei]CAJ6165576.1 DNA-dependent RNA polymerase [Burkholderia pseudomallei]CAJ7355199.1 DNA-dependent RNA polymerase [Burkholderia pseudomallei]CAJ9276010.1 DNA-dependent RNA polymerase [Burkholderia pseudomallei]